MNALRLVVLPCFFFSVVTSLFLKSPSLHHDAGLDILQLVTKYGYPIESHKIQTEDGYILTLHRIPHGTNTSTANQYPVLLMHGLLCSSVDWVNSGPGNALALLLADNGFDVWLGNQRGNTWSRQHVSVDPNTQPEKFFDFSFHEIGMYDLPAKIDYILKKSGKEKIFYVGHSQGTTSFFVMTSMKPEYNEKIELMLALAPVAYLTNIPNPVVVPILDNYELIQTLIKIMKVYEVLPHNEILVQLGTTLCVSGSPYQKLCTWVLNMIAGFNKQIEPDFIPVISSNTPAGCSMKQLQHYLQEIKSGDFAQFDYGSEKNVLKYKKSTPPLYNISRIKAPISLYYANNDWLDAVEDVLQLSEELPNVSNVKKVPMNDFNHLDFLWARDVDEILYKDVINEMNARK